MVKFSLCLIKHHNMEMNGGVEVNILFCCFKLCFQL
jgi:hypothetical protein